MTKMFRLTITGNMRGPEVMRSVDLIGAKANAQTFDDETSAHPHELFWISRSASRWDAVNTQEEILYTIEHIERVEVPAVSTKGPDIADALSKCDWSGVSIGNKAIIAAAAAHLRGTPAPIAFRELAERVNRETHRGYPRDFTKVDHIEHILRSALAPAKPTIAQAEPSDPVYPPGTVLSYGSSSPVPSGAGGETRVRHFQDRATGLWWTDLGQGKPYVLRDEYERQQEK